MTSNDTRLVDLAMSTDMEYVNLLAGDPPPTFTASERRTLQRLLDQEWQRVNREREQDTHLNETALVYLQDLESLQRKLTA